VPPGTAACYRTEVLAHTPYLTLLCASSTPLLVITKNLAAANRAFNSPRFTITRPQFKLPVVGRTPGVRKEEGGGALPFCLALVNLLGGAGVAFEGAEGGARFF
jgi:hypothetical protein